MERTAPAAPRTVIARRGNLVTFTSPGGGVGLTTLMALCGLTLAKRGIGCALMDADLTGGGLGVLLGIEHEPGLTMQDLDAPLGHIEGDALNHELPQWEGIRVLAHAPWLGEDPDEWELQAAANALCAANELVLADAGRGEALRQIPALAKAPQIVAIELSALGLARARSHLAMLERLRAGDGTDDPPIVVGVEPRGTTKRAASSAVALREAVERFGDDALGPMRCDPALCADIMNGLGIRAVPKQSRQVINALSDRIADPTPPTRTARHRAPKPRRR
ncbi:cobalamin biosynthesis protein CobQ [Bifidobacterium santillanense]|nr:cobalamin biosynthesis protein CobQ [Bifidobacterium santillanense]